MINSFIVKTYPTSSQFLEETEPFLLEKETENAVILTSAKQSQSKQKLPAGFYCGTVWNREGQLVFAMANLEGALLQGSWTDNEQAVELLVQDFVSVGLHNFADKIRAFEPSVEYMHRALEKIGNRKYKVVNLVWSHVCQKVIWSSKLQQLASDDRTELKQATMKDLLLLIQWTRGFFDYFVRNGFDDASSIPPIKETCQKGLEEESPYILWINGEPVSMAWRRRPTVNGCAISLVYTPDEKRGNGFAGVCVALLTEKILKQFKYATLFVMRQQDPHNNLYTSIGYRLCGKETKLKAIDEK